MEKETRSIVKRSNYMIEGHTNLSLLQYKLIILMTTKIKKTDEEIKPVTFSYSQLAEKLHIGENNHDYIDKITTELMKKIIYIKENNNYEKYQWLSYASYIDGIYTLEFHPKLKPFLIKLSEYYTIYDLENILALQSAHAIKIYELLKQYSKIGVRSFSLDDFKICLGLSVDNYPRYTDFKRFVIIPAQKQIKEHTDIYFDFKTIKDGRKVIGLTFYIHASQVEKQLGEAEPQTAEIDDILRQQNIIIGSTALQKTVNLLKANFTLEEIAKIAVVLAEKTKKGLIENAAGMLVSDPVGIGKSVLNGTLYSKDDKKTKNKGYQEYELFVPPLKIG